MKINNLSNSKLLDDTAAIDTSFISDDNNRVTVQESDISDATMTRRSWYKRTFGRMEKGSLRSSIISLMSCAMGSGLLAFPSNARNSGLILGVVLMITCAIISRLSMYLLIQLSFRTNITSFTGLVDHALGKPFRRVFEANIIFYMYGTVVCLQIMFANFLWEACVAFGVDESQKHLFIIIFNLSFIVLNLPISMLRDVYQLRYFSQLQLAVIAYIAIAIFVYFVDTFDATKINANIKLFIIDLNLFTSFASTFFGYITHQLILPLKKELQRSSSKRMGKVCDRATLFTFLAYAIIMVMGYLTWLDQTETIIIDNYTNTYFTIAKAGMAFALFFSVPININPMRTAILEMINKKNSKKAFWITTFSVQISTGLLALVYPNVKSGFGFLGGFLGLNMVVVVPGLMYLKVFGYSSKSIIIGLTCLLATILGYTGAVLSQILKD